MARRSKIKIRIKIKKKSKSKRKRKITTGEEHAHEYVGMAPAPGGGSELLVVPSAPGPVLAEGDVVAAGGLGGPVVVGAGAAVFVEEIHAGVGGGGVGDVDEGGAAIELVVADVHEDGAAFGCDGGLAGGAGEPVALPFHR